MVNGTISRKYVYQEDVEEVNDETLIRLQSVVQATGGRLAFAEYWVPNEQLKPDREPGDSVRVFETFDAVFAVHFDRIEW